MAVGPTPHSEADTATVVGSQELCAWLGVFLQCGSGPSLAKQAAQRTLSSHIRAHMAEGWRDCVSGTKIPIGKEAVSKTTHLENASRNSLYNIPPSKLEAPRASMGCGSSWGLGSEVRDSRLTLHG